MKRYKVVIDDNFNYARDAERQDYAQCYTLSSAVAECQRVITEDLKELLENEPDLTPDELFENWAMFGEEPWIVGDSTFSAHEFARRKANSLAKKASNSWLTNIINVAKSWFRADSN